MDRTLEEKERALAVSAELAARAAIESAEPVLNPFQPEHNA
jgi:hypothetical protein